MMALKNRVIDGSRYLWIIALCISAFFVCSGSLPTDLMESRNLVTAHEMVTYDNWLLPTMNGDLRLEKPPFPTWVAGLIELGGGDSLPAQRAAAGVMGVLWTLFFMLTVEVVTGNRKTALLSTVIFLTCYNVVLMGRTATWDIYCHAFMQGAIWLLFRIYYGATPLSRSKVFWAFTGAGLLLGLSFLSKGPVSFFALLLPFIVACCFIGRRPGRASVGGLIWMLVLTIIVSAWWYIYIYCFHSDLATAVLHKESGAWLSHNVRPWWYYWRYFLETGVWALLTPVALFTPILSKRFRHDPALKFSVIWMVATVVLLSLMPEKKMRYLLPVMAPAAMSVGVWLQLVAEYGKRWRAGEIIFKINGWLVTLITLGISGVVIYLCLCEGKVDTIVAIVSALMLLCVAVWMVLSTIRVNVISFVDAVGALFIVAECLLMSQITHFFVNPDLHPIEGVRYEPKLGDIPFYIDDDQPVRMELVLAAGRRIRPIHFADSDTVLSLLPCAVLTHKSVAESFDERVLQECDTLYIDTYDDNRHASTDKHYSTLLKNRVTILTRKGEGKGR